MFLPPWTKPCHLPVKDALKMAIFRDDNGVVARDVGLYENYAVFVREPSADISGPAWGAPATSILWDSPTDEKGLYVARLTRR